jgi:multiple sugar transport system substrate-binding protein
VTIRLLLLAALVAGLGVPAAAAEPTTIVFYQRGYNEGGADAPSVATRKAVDLFEQANPDVRVQILGLPYSEEGDAKFDAALSSRAPDLARLTNAQLPGYARRGLLSEVTPWLTQEDKKDIFPAALAAASHGGKTYAWPLWVTAITVIANAELLKERGIEPPSFDKPWRFDRFAEACGQLSFERKDGTKVVGLGYGLAVPALLYIDGGRVLSPDGKTFWANRPQALSALEKIAGLHKKRHCLTDDFMQANEPKTREPFEKGQVAMLLSPPGYLRVLAEKKFPFVVLPLPVGALGKPVTTGAFGLYAVVRQDDAKRTAAAHRLARWLTGSEVGRLVPGYQLAPGLRRSNTNLDDDGLFSPVAKAVRYGVYEAPTEVPDAVSRLGLVEAMRSAVFGGVTPKAAMDAYAPVLQAALDAAN